MTPHHDLTTPAVRGVVCLLGLALLVCLVLVAPVKRAQAQDDESRRVFMLPVEGDSDTERILSAGQLFFRDMLTETGQFRFAGTQDTEVVFSDCREDIGSNPAEERRCQLAAARRSFVDWVLDLGVRTITDTDFVVTLEVWDPEENEAVYTASEPVSGDFSMDASRGALEKLGCRFLAAPQVDVATERCTSGSGGQVVRSVNTGGDVRPQGRLEVMDIRPAPARLAVNGTEVGIVPGQHFGLPTGEVTVELRADGYSPEQRTMTLEPGVLQQLRGVRLDPMPATIEVVSNVEGAAIVVDGTEMGQTVYNTPVAIEASADATVLTVRREGYTTFSTALDLVPGSMQRVEVALTPGQAETDPTPTPVRTERRAGFSEIELSPGFSEPQVSSGVAYGTQSAPQDCRGYIAEQPGHIVTLTSSMDYLRFYLTESAGDTVMVIDGPGGIRCDDDTNGLWPQVEGSFDAGTYQVWVGTYAESREYAYTLAIASQSAEEVESSDLVPDTVNPTFSTISAGQGFADPMVSSGVADGVRPAPEDCNGYIAEQPGHRLIVPSDRSYLRLYLTESGGDTVMVVSGPNGVRCDDDTHGLWPQVAGEFPAGEYLVWVGTYGQYNQYNYTLAVSARSEEAPPEIAQPAGDDPLGINQDPLGISQGSAGESGAFECTDSTFDCVRVAPGFLPDPISVTGLSGGGNTAPSGCNGYIATQPDHRLYISQPMSFLRIRVASAEGDTTLVLNGPDGVSCNDDFEGLNPGLEGSFAAGVYDIYVGSYSQGQNHDYTLEMTEYR